MSLSLIFFTMIIPENMHAYYNSLLIWYNCSNCQLLKYILAPVTIYLFIVFPVKQGITDHSK